MHIFLKNSGKVLFTDEEHLNRNSLNRKVLTVSLESSIAPRESLWVQFGDNEDFENVRANVLEPIRLSKEGDVYKTLFPKEVLIKPGVWYMTFGVRLYSIDGTVFSEQSTSDKVSFTVNDNFPLEDDGYVSNATVENVWQQIGYSIDVAEQNALSAESSAKAAKISELNAATSEENSKNSEEKAEQSAKIAKNSADNLASLVDRQIKFVPELPEKGDEKLIYAIVSNVDGNLFDLYAWINGERHYFGSANLVTDTDKQFFRTLKADGWKSNKQHFEIDGLSNASKILVTPIDSCAAQYLSAGIELSTDENTLVITCENTPTEDLEILIQIQYLTEIPSLSGYYTIPQIDGKVGNKVKLTIDNETYVMTMQLISADGTVLSTGVIDLPLESMVVGGRYDNDAEKIVLTLKNGSSVDIPAADIIDGLASQTALDTEIQDRKDADTVLQSKLTKKINLTLDKNAWGNRVQTLSVAGVTGINSVNVYPKDESAAEYILCGVSAIQAYGLVTFTCAEVPTKNLLVTAEIAG